MSSLPLFDLSYRQLDGYYRNVVLDLVRINFEPPQDEKNDTNDYYISLPLTALFKGRQANKKIYLSIFHFKIKSDIDVGKEIDYRYHLKYNYVPHFIGISIFLINMYNYKKSDLYSHSCNISSYDNFLKIGLINSFMKGMFYFFFYPIMSVGMLDDFFCGCLKNHFIPNFAMTIQL